MVQFTLYLITIKTFVSVLTKIQPCKIFLRDLPERIIAFCKVYTLYHYCYVIKIPDVDKLFQDI